MPEAKTNRNLEVFCKKEGLEKPEQYMVTQPKEKKTYRELSDEYDLSITMLQRIVNRERERYKKK